MWGSFVLLLVFTIFPLSSWSAAALPMLTAPSSLRTGNASHKAVLLEWDFRESEDLKISDVLFLVSLEAEPPHERRLHRLRYKTTELSFSFEDLLPGKVYIASVVATNPKWLDSPPSQISFTTMEKDWSTPEINSVIKTPRRDIAQYSVTWSELPSPGLTHVVVEVCDSNCTSYTPGTTAVSTLVTVKFDSRFLIRICAFYNADVVGPIERCSRYFQGISARAPPERLLSMKNVRKVGTKVQLDWHPRLPLDGPRSYYEIYARDLNPRKSERSPIDPSKKDSIFSLALSALTDTDFELRYVTLGYERMLWHKRNPHLDITLFDLEPYQRDEPLQLKVIRMTRRRVHSLILFRTEVDKSSWFDMSTPPEHLILGAENFTFSGHKPVDFLIRTCLTYNVSGLGVCGNITATRIRNCVDGPDEVASPGYQFNGTDIEIFWKASEEPRGPIDGYRLTLIATKFGRTDKVILGPNERSYLIEDETGRAEYIVYIAAFNVDIDCGNYNNTKLFGKSVFLKVVRSHWSIRDMLLLGIRVCAAIIIGELVLSWWSYWKPDQHFATAMLWLLKRSLELYIEGWQILIRLIVLRIRRYL